MASLVHSLLGLARSPPSCNASILPVVPSPCILPRLTLSNSCTTHASSGAIRCAGFEGPRGEVNRSARSLRASSCSNFPLPGTRKHSEQANAGSELTGSGRERRISAWARVHKLTRRVRALGVSSPRFGLSHPSTRTLTSLPPSVTLFTHYIDNGTRPSPRHSARLAGATDCRSVPRHAVQQHDGARARHLDALRYAPARRRLARARKGTARGPCTLGLTHSHSNAGGGGGWGCDAAATAWAGGAMALHDPGHRVWRRGAAPIGQIGGRYEALRTLDC